MNEAILIQILLVLAVIAGILFIAILWRVFQVMTDIKTITSTIAARVKDIDQSIERTKEMLTEFIDGVKNFVYSFGFMQAIKGAIKTNKKGE